MIERTLQPIWYKTVTLSLELPRDLSLAPKVSVRTQHSSIHGMAAYGHRKFGLGIAAQWRREQGREQGRERGPR